LAKAQRIDRKASQIGGQLHEMKKFNREAGFVSIMLSSWAREHPHY